MGRKPGKKGVRGLTETSTSGTAGQPLTPKINTQLVARLKITDAKTREASEILALVNLDSLALAANAMIDIKANQADFGNGLLSLVAVPIPPSTEAK